MDVSAVIRGITSDNDVEKLTVIKKCKQLFSAPGTAVSDNIIQADIPRKLVKLLYHDNR